MRLTRIVQCFTYSMVSMLTLHWYRNERDGVTNHQLHDCLLNRLFRHRSKETSKLCVTGLCEGIHRWPVNSPHKGPVTRKCFHLMTSSWLSVTCSVSQLKMHPWHGYTFYIIGHLSGKPFVTGGFPDQRNLDKIWTSNRIAGSWLSYDLTNKELECKWKWHRFRPVSHILLIICHIISIVFGTTALTHK